MKGRKPKPTAQHELAGNPSKLNLETRKANEPTPPAGPPPQPAWLTPDGLIAWQELVAQLGNMGLLAKSDGIAIASIAQEFSIYRAAMAEVNKPDGGLVVDVNGHPEDNPYLRVADKAHKRLVRLLVEFGLTPSSRSRIAIERSDKSEEMGIMAFIRKESR